MTGNLRSYEAAGVFACYDYTNLIRNTMYRSCCCRNESESDHDDDLYEQQ